MDRILDACPKLEELSIEQTRFIDCRENGPLHKSLKTIDISSFSHFEDGFLTRLSARVLSLQDVKLEIDKQDIISDGGEIYDIVMPFTHFNTLRVNATSDRDDDRRRRTNQDVNVKLIINKYNNNNDDSAAATITTQYYHCFVSAAATLPLLKKLIN